MGKAAAAAAVLVLAIMAAASSTAAAVTGEVKCGGCSPCGSADCPPVVYPSPPPPAFPPPPPYYYYSPPPPASYPGVSYCPPPPAAYIEIGGSTPSGKGPLYPQDPGFMPSSAPPRWSRAAVSITACAFAALSISSLWSIFW